MAWFVYLARCADGSLYTGVTTDPARRERAHNRGRGAAYTRSRRPVRLVHLEPARDRGAALRRELEIKRMTRAGKEALMGRGGAGARGRRFEGFSAEALRFLRRLRRNNRKDWFERNRAVYETAVRDPMRALVEEMDVRLARIAPELMGDPRRSVFRIHRDVRFSRDKTPYKTACAASVGPFYVQVSADGLLVAGGGYRWAPDQIARFRTAVDDERRGEDLAARLGTLTATMIEGAAPTVAGDLLATRPRGIAPDHPRLELLRHRSLYAHRGWEPDDVLHEPRAAQRVAEVWRATRPLTDWIDDHVGAPEHRR